MRGISGGISRPISARQRVHLVSRLPGGNVPAREAKDSLASVIAHRPPCPHRVPTKTAPGASRLRTRQDDQMSGAAFGRQPTDASPLSCLCGHRRRPRAAGGVPAEGESAAGRDLRQQVGGPVVVVAGLPGGSLLVPAGSLPRARLLAGSRGVIPAPPQTPADALVDVAGAPAAVRHHPVAPILDLGGDHWQAPRPGSPVKCRPDRRGTSARQRRADAHRSPRRVRLVPGWRHRAGPFARRSARRAARWQPAVAPPWAGRSRRPDH